ncbi:MAG TPA: hypothetical protein VFU23_14415 [Gemmatimonadales bacterium]|nr:hypothetical protein [Gemmatimonadales bacterium]
MRGDEPKPGADSGEPGSPGKDDLLEAFDGVVNRERERAVASRSLPLARRTHWVAIVLCVVAWGALAYIWIGRPAWLFGGDPAASPSRAEKETRIRFGLYLERERVLDYRASHHRLPGSLEEAGDVETGVDYAVTSDSTFVVSAMLRDSLITLNESQSADELLKPTGIAAARPR